MKKEIRILGIDDMPFSFNDEKTGIVGVVMRGGTYLEGVLKSEVEIDGRDASDAIINMVKNSRHAGQLKIIMVDGVALGGFNVIDGEKIYNETNLPVITVTREFPCFSYDRQICLIVYFFSIYHIESPQSYSINHYYF